MFAYFVHGPDGEKPSSQKDLCAASQKFVELAVAATKGPWREEVLACQNGYEPHELFGAAITHVVSTGARPAAQNIPPSKRARALAVLGCYHKMMLQKCPLDVGLLKKLNFAKSKKPTFALWPK